MAIVHIHIEKTGGITMQKLYEDKYGPRAIAHYMNRDNIFAPYSIKHARYTKNISLKFYKFISAYLPTYRHYLVSKRTRKRKEQEIGLDELENASIIIDHFDVRKTIDKLNPKEHQYRSIVRDPLERVWSHFKYWKEHNGDVGQRIVPKYKKDITFEEFALLPEMLNYQTSALGKDLSIYKVIGITEELDKFAVKTGLIEANKTAPVLNKLNSRHIPNLTKDFIREFRKLNKDDYRLYESVAIKW